jgi:dynein heavy chain
MRDIANKCVHVCALSRGLFEEHKRLFSFLLCTSILRKAASGGISDVEWSCLVRGPATTLACHQGAASNSSSHNRPRPQQLQWLPVQAWEGLQALEQCLPQLAGLMHSWQQQADAWQQW